MKRYWVKFEDWKFVFVLVSEIDFEYNIILRDNLFLINYYTLSTHNGGYWYIDIRRGDLFFINPYISSEECTKQFSVRV